MTGRPEDRIWTVPNVLSGVRLLGCVPLAWLGWRGDRTGFVVLLIVLLFTDWVDGKLAVALDQRTELGPGLDSAADALMYGVVALSFWWLEPEVLVSEAGWLVVAVGTWVVSAAVGVARFGKVPSYHTRAAKTGWLVVGSVALYTIWSGDGRAVPWALAWVVLTNLEAVAIGLLLPGWRADVPTVAHALRERRATGGDRPDESADRHDEGEDRPDEGGDGHDEGGDRRDEGEESP